MSPCKIGEKGGKGYGETKYFKTELLLYKLILNLVHLKYVKKLDAWGDLMRELPFE